MQSIRLPLDNRPAHKVAIIPETKLGGKKEPTKKLITPPRVADNIPK
jgi:hypothetical protein